MKTFSRRMLTGVLCLAVLLAALLWPGLPWSARYRHVLKRLAVRAEMKVSAWQGEPPKLVSLKGQLFTRQPDKEYLKGVEVEALDSLSGWAALTDKEGRFLLPDLVWYPQAKYSLILAASPYQVRQIEVISPVDYPESKTLDLGELDFDRGCRIDPKDLQGSNSTHLMKYDSSNDAYYRALFDQITAGKATDEEKLDAINRHVSGKYTDSISVDIDLSPRQTLERGSRTKGQIALALATLAAAGNYRVRLVDLINDPARPSPHVISEIYYDEGWHVYDSLLGEAFRNIDHEAASYKELRLDTGLIKSSAEMQRLEQSSGYGQNWMTELYSSGIHHYYYLDRK